MNKSVYRRPNKQKTLVVKDRRSAAALPALDVIPPPLEVDAFSECHVTPPEVAGRMVSYLGEVGDFLTLEPEAGTGNILEALLNSGHSVNETVAIERHIGLCHAIEKRFKDEQYIQPISSCFLEYAEGAAGRIEYPRIIMNPPFRKTKKHIEAALSLLGRGGHNLPAALVALVPITFKHDEAETLEILPNTTFPTAKVNTKIIKIER